MTVNRTRVLLALMLAAIFAAGVQAQDRKQRKEDASMRVVQGIVLDADDKPVIGAVVQLKDMRTLQVRSFITLDDGKYHFSGLKIDNDYQLKADHSGMTSGWKTLSVFDSRKVPVINLKMDKKKE
jgi:hypothetical protein